MPMLDYSKNPFFQPAPELSMAFLQSPAYNTTGRSGQYIFNPMSNSYTQIGTPNQWGWNPNQFSQGVQVGNTSTITPERATALGLKPQGTNYVWNPTSSDLQNYQNYWSSPTGQNVLSSYSQGGANYTNRTVPQGVTTYGAGNNQAPSGVSPLAQALAPVTATTTPAQTAAPATTVPTTASTNTGNQFNYPMNPLADMYTWPSIVAQRGLLGMMMSEPYMQASMRPYLEQAFDKIGRSGLPSSSYADRIISQTIGDIYTQNLNKVLGGYQQLPGQLSTLANVYLDPYKNFEDQLQFWYGG